MSNERFKLRVRKEEAFEILCNAHEDTTYQGAIREPRWWSVDKDGFVEPHSICWLFCWTVGQRGHQEITSAFKKLMPFSYEDFYQKVGRANCQAWRDQNLDGDGLTQTLRNLLGMQNQAGEGIRTAQLTLESQGEFSPTDETDAREKVFSQIARRRGQKRFRDALLREYEYKCAITGCDAEDALEAAHVVRYLGEKSDHIENGILLRADIHTLFDLDLIAIDPSSMEIVVANSLKGTTYQTELQGKRLGSHRIRREALNGRWATFMTIRGD